MKGTGADETAIRKLAAERAAGLGAHIAPQDVALTWMPEEAAPGCRVFRVSWGVGPWEGALTGLLQDAEPPDVSPAQALGKIFRRWLATTGAPPHPARIAAVAAFLYDAGQVHTPILTTEDCERLIIRAEWRPYVQLPVHSGATGQPGIAFWWVGRSGPSQVRLYLPPNGPMRSEETFIQDLIGP